MNGDNIFLDSNILIYAYSSDELPKRAIVEDVLNKHDSIILSTQTINEFIYVMTKKKKLNYEQISLVINELPSIFSVELITNNVIQKALHIAQIHHYSYWDSLMIASALISNCSILYSEDMHHKHMIDDHLKIVNPFK